VLYVRATLSPPSNYPPQNLWDHLPSAKRKRLIWVLSQMLEQQMITPLMEEQNHDS
jgi:membrane carboxypeptidase/penicillin-binding protein